MRTTELAVRKALLQARCEMDRVVLCRSVTRARDALEPSNWMRGSLLGSLFSSGSRRSDGTVRSGWLGALLQLVRLGQRHPGAVATLLPLVLKGGRLSRLIKLAGAAVLAARLFTARP